MTRAWSWAKRVLCGLVMGLTLLVFVGTVLWLGRHPCTDSTRSDLPLAPIDG